MWKIKCFDDEGLFLGFLQDDEGQDMEFDTQQEASTAIGIEGMQLEANGVYMHPAETALFFEKYYGNEQYCLYRCKTCGKTESTGRYQEPKGCMNCFVMGDFKC